ncbi:unnamed protein product [Dibothriocephalus latus]|uniref:Uncharacterized protein n=1 Tax=Dibothriocephalus latus TaxID=60516 RepID=A0A3P7NVS4_DIBLA|nr:unnamed protein product [Dibothriocephalus latus]
MCDDHRGPQFQPSCPIAAAWVANSDFGSNLPKELRFQIEEYELDNATAVDEFVLLMKMVSTTLLLGLLVAILCPLCTMIADHRYEKRKLQKHREKQKAIESLLTLKLDVEKEAKARTAAATENADEGERATAPSVSRHTRSARQSMAMISDIMRAQALKRASSHTLGEVGPRGRPTEAMGGNTSEKTMSGRKTEFLLLLVSQLLLLFLLIVFLFHLPFLLLLPPHCLLPPTPALNSPSPSDLDLFLFIPDSPTCPASSSSGPSYFKFVLSRFSLNTMTLRVLLSFTPSDEMLENRPERKSSYCRVSLASESHPLPRHGDTTSNQNFRTHIMQPSNHRSDSAFDRR